MQYQQCPVCASLLQEYRRAVAAFADKMQNGKGALGQDFFVALEQARRLHTAARAAADRLDMHLKREHKTGAGALGARAAGLPGG